MMREREKKETEGKKPTKRKEKRSWGRWKRWQHCHNGCPISFRYTQSAHTPTSPEPMEYLCVFATRKYTYKIFLTPLRCFSLSAGASLSFFALFCHFLVQRQGLFHTTPVQPQGACGAQVRHQNTSGSTGKWPSNRPGMH